MQIRSKISVFQEQSAKSLTGLITNNGDLNKTSNHRHCCSYCPEKEINGDLYEYFTVNILYAGQQCPTTYLT